MATLDSLHDAIYQGLPDVDGFTKHFWNPYNNDNIHGDHEDDWFYNEDDGNAHLLFVV